MFWRRILQNDFFTRDTEYFDNITRAAVAGDQIIFHQSGSVRYAAGNHDSILYVSVRPVHVNRHETRFLNSIHKWDILNQDIQFLTDYRELMIDR